MGLGVIDGGIARHVQTGGPEAFGEALGVAHHRRLIGKKGELKYGLWETIESRAFPGSVSNHHLGTQLGLLMAAYEMNQFKVEPVTISAPSWKGFWK